MSSTQEEVKMEYVSIYVPETLAKEIRNNKDKKGMEEQIILNYIKVEKDFLEQEMKEVDDITIKYKAKLIGIKEAFAKSQSSYIEEIESMMQITSDKFSKFDDITKGLEAKTKSAYADVTRLSEAVGYLNFERLDGLLNAVDRYNNMSEIEKEIIEKLLIK